MWIKDYREREGLELYQLQQRVNSFIHKMSNPIEATISGELIHMLEVDKNAVTHPRIANAIAIMCDATQEQRDMIVADVHKGKWFGPTEEENKLANKVRNMWEEREMREFLIKNVPIQQTQPEQRAPSNPYPKNRKEIVKVDRTANVVARYKSIKAAVKAEYPTSTHIIIARCRRQLKREFSVENMDIKHNNGTPVNYTFRYAEEWDNMTREQQIMDINRTIIAKEDVL